LLSLVDTHCHLNFHTFQEDREEVLERAVDAGVEKIINPGIDLQTSLEALSLAQRSPYVFAAVGVHPNDSITWEVDTRDQLADYARHPKVVAIGEIGLDYYRDRAPQDVQQRVFREQLELAADLGLPVIIHNRDATEDTLAMLVEWQSWLETHNPMLARAPGVLHSYSGNLQQARTAWEHNFCIGITGPVTFKKADELREVVADMPVDALLVETDAPFLTPHPHRGQRNEPAYVRFVAAKIAELQAVSSEQIAETTTSNADRLFKW
jgi:TatD DNase family protein